MIGKVTRGSDAGGLLRYLYGPGRANEHVRPHLVASWAGDARVVLDALEPNRAGGLGYRGLAARMSLPLRLVPDAVDRPVWQCSMRTAPGDRRLSDVEWAAVAREVVERTGFAPAQDPGGCRWVAVRHADDHVHVLVLLARQDGGAVRVFRDWPKVHAAARAMEQRLGLVAVRSPDRTATVAPSRAESEKATRLGRGEAARAWLSREVRVAAAGSTSLEEFASVLTARGDVAIGWRESQRTPGELTGFRVGRVGDVDVAGRQVWFSGSKLSPDLSLPKLRARWAEVGSPVPRPRSQPLTPAERQRILVDSRLALTRATRQPINDVTAISTGEVASVLARIAEGRDGGPLTAASDHLARAVRHPGGVRPDTSHQVHVLRHVAADLSLLGHLLPDDAGDAALLAAHLARIAAAVKHVRSDQLKAFGEPRRRASLGMPERVRTPDQVRQPRGNGLPRLRRP